MPHLFNVMPIDHFIQQHIGLLNENKRLVTDHAVQMTSCPRVRSISSCIRERYTWVTLIGCALEETLYLANKCALTILQTIKHSISKAVTPLSSYALFFNTKNPVVSCFTQFVFLKEL